MRYKGLSIREDGLMETAYYWYDIKPSKIIAKHLVKKWEVGRPDLISFKYYGTPDYYWLILVANNKTIFDLQEGEWVVIPSLDGVA